MRVDRMMKRLSGYDESFLGWGSEDVNYAVRAARIGKTEMIDLGPMVMHQWHPTTDRAFAAQNHRKTNQENSNGPNWGRVEVLEYLSPGVLIREPW